MSEIPGAGDPAFKSPDLKAEQEKTILIETLKTFTDKYPQLNPEGKLIYVLGGSLSIRIIGSSNEIEMVQLDEEGRPVSVSQLPDEWQKTVTKTLSSHIRPSKDIDCVAVLDQDEGCPEHKGSTGLATTNNPIFEKPSVPMDVANTLFPLDIVKTTINGQEIYCGSPLYLLINKFNQATEFEQSSGKFVNDIEGLLKTCQEMYADQLPTRALQILHAGSLAATKGELTLPFGNPDLPKFLIDFYNSLIEVDENFRYIADVPELAERRLEVLQVLRLYKDEEVKTRIIEFLSQNAQFLNEHRTISRHANNLSRIAEKICRDSTLYSDLQKRSHDEKLQEIALDSPEAIERVRNMIDSNSWIIDHYGKLFKDELIQVPRRSEVLQFLSLELNEATIEQDLYTLEQGIKRSGDIFGYILERFLNKPYIKMRPQNRERILHFIDYVVSNGSDGQVASIRSDLSRVLEGELLDDEPDDPLWEGLKEEEFFDKRRERSLQRMGDQEWIEDQITQLAELYGFEF